MSPFLCLEWISQCFYLSIILQHCVDVFITSNAGAIKE